MLSSLPAPSPPRNWLRVVGFERHDYCFKSSRDARKSGMHTPHTKILRPTLLDDRWQFLEENRYCLFWIGG